MICTAQMNYWKLALTQWMTEHWLAMVLLLTYSLLLVHNAYIGSKVSAGLDDPTLMRARRKYLQSQEGGRSHGK